MVLTINKKKFRTVDLRKFYRSYRNARLRVPEWRNSNAKYFQSRSFMLEVLALNHLAPDSWTFSTVAPTILYTHTQIASFAPPLCLLRIWILYQRNNKVPELETEKFATVLSLFLSPVLCFLITCVTLLTTSLFVHRVIPRATKSYLSQKAWYLWLLFNNIETIVQIRTMEYLIK